MFSLGNLATNQLSSKLKTFSEWRAILTLGGLAASQSSPKLKIVLSDNQCSHLET
jgi:hypothetical protein